MEKSGLVVLLVIALISGSCGKSKSEGASDNKLDEPKQAVKEGSGDVKKGKSEGVKSVVKLDSMKKVETLKAIEKADLGGKRNKLIEKGKNRLRKRGANRFSKGETNFIIKSYMTDKKNMRKENQKYIKLLESYIKKSNGKIQEVGGPVVCFEEKKSKVKVTVMIPVFKTSKSTKDYQFLELYIRFVAAIYHVDSMDTIDKSYKILKDYIKKSKEKYNMKISCEETSKSYYDKENYFMITQIYYGFMEKGGKDTEGTKDYYK
ncbi:hypothetical protein KKF34_11370 [Myxococcota bacterium]|nr:hypothetical protein [Myxococcota bacterium]MBU1380443.1 hypothetical protein [Myxococcota bacterium]MBU1497463.1 hypothetical protein [Myxococcota bacterium]